MSIGSCTSMTLRMYANHKKIDLQDVKIRLVYERLDNKEERITRYFSFKGNITDDQRNRLLEIADKCPVHKTIENHPIITSALDDF